MSSPRFTLDTRPEPEACEAIEKVLRRRSGPVAKQPRFDVAICSFPPSWAPSIDEPIPTQPTLPIVKVAEERTLLFVAQSVVTAFNWGNPARDEFYAVAVPSHVNA